MGRSKDVLRVGDRVRVNDPRFVLRVGYPKCPGDYMGEIRKEFGERVLDLLREAGGIAAVRTSTLNTMMENLLRSRLNKSPSKMERRVDQILRELAYLRCAAAKHGGSVRSLHLSESFERYRGRECVIQQARTVYEGDRVSGYRSYENEYEPPSFENACARRLFDVGLRESNRFSRKTLWFPKEHLVKMSQETSDA